MAGPAPDFRKSLHHNDLRQKKVQNILFFLFWYFWGFFQV